MKKVWMAFASVVLLTACGDEAPETPVVDQTEVEPARVDETDDYGMFGDEITAEGAIEMAEFKTAMTDKKEWEGKLKTQINSCCQKKGCWMMVDMGEGEEMRVTFKDYGFFVPLDCAEKPVIMEGKAYYDTVSVETLKHLAEDANATQEEIDAITEPEMALAFEATGVMIEGMANADASMEHGHAHDNGDYSHDHNHEHDGDANHDHSGDADHAHTGTDHDHHHGDEAEHHHN